MAGMARFNNIEQDEQINNIFERFQNHRKQEAIHAELKTGFKDELFRNMEEGKDYLVEYMGEYYIISAVSSSKTTLNKEALARHANINESDITAVKMPELTENNRVSSNMVKSHLEKVDTERLRVRKAKTEVVEFFVGKRVDDYEL